MSVITPSERADPIVFITNGVMCADGIPFDLEQAREFSVGDIVYFVDFYKNANISQEYASWFVRFHTDDGKVYSAVQDYFVTMDEWEDISNYFADKLSGSL